MDPIREAADALLTCVHKFSDVPDADVQHWLTSAAMQIWAANRLCSEDYANILHSITGEQYSTAQILTAIRCAGEEGRKLKIPRFFQDLVTWDIQNRINISRKFIEATGLFLVELAVANGDFTIEEAHALQGILDEMSAYCDTMKISPYPIRVWDSSRITPLKSTGYYQQKGPEKKQPAEPPASPETKAPKKPSDDPKPPVSSEPFLDAPAGTVTSSTSEEDTLESVLEELNSLVGMEQVKKDIQSLLNFIRVCQLRGARGMKVPKVSYHLVFTGNPGTGKTTVARLVAKLYYLMGILPRDQLVETDRSGLVAGYLGQTAIKTQKVIQDALGGVLFIDEAYSLANDKEDSYGKEAIETLLKAMEDHRDELVVIVAGYDGLMHHFIDSNPGLRSRFNKYFHFPDYDGGALLKIMEHFCNMNGYALEDEALPLLQQKLEQTYQVRSEHFGNARFVRNLFELAIHCQADRLSSEQEITDEALMLLTGSDVLTALEGL